jgi:hypothetical protein
MQVGTGSEKGEGEVEKMGDQELLIPLFVDIV